MSEILAATPRSVPLWLRLYLAVPRRALAAVAAAYATAGAWLTPRATARRRRILRAYAERVGWPVAALDHRMRASRILAALDTPLSLYVDIGGWPGVLRVEGESYRREALARGRGVVVAFDHISLHPVLQPYLREAGYAGTVAVPREAGAGRASPMVRALRAVRKGVWYRGRTCRTMSRSGLAREALHALRRGDAVLVASDGAAGDQVRCTFLGVEVNRAAGPMRLALANRAPVIAAIAVPEADPRYRLALSPPIGVRSDVPRAGAAYRDAPWIARGEMVEQIARGVAHAGPGPAVERRRAPEREP